MITIIIPTYKTQDYFSECLNSLEKQTIEKTIFEVIIVLNGDKEPYYSKIEKYLTQTLLHNVRLVFTEQKGVSNARNIGLDNATGNFIVFLDDDDFLSNNYLLDLYTKVNKTQNTIVVSNVKTYNPKKNIYGVDYISKAFFKNKDKSFSLFNYRSFFSSVCGKIIPVRVIDKIRFNKAINISEDALFMFALSKNINAVLFSAEECIYYRRLNMNSASRTKRSLFSNFRIMCKVILNYSKVYFFSITRYNFIFFISRVFASIKLFLKRII